MLIQSNEWLHCDHICFTSNEFLKMKFNTVKNRLQIILPCWTEGRLVKVWDYWMSVRMKINSFELQSRSKTPKNAMININWMQLFTCQWPMMALETFDQKKLFSSQKIGVGYKYILHSTSNYAWLARHFKWHALLSL